jgi:uncharacterized cupin superfamily protein
MTAEAVRAIHGAPARARVSSYKYGPGSKEQGVSKQGTAYVLDGHITFMNEDGTSSFERGDVFTFSGGDYVLIVNGTGEATVVWAWDLPPEFWVTN